MNFGSFYKDTESRRTEFITHLPHLEDLVFIKKQKGVETIQNIINNLNNRKTNVSYKLDGSPSIFFGIDPVDNKPFVSNKSLTSLAPKIAKSKADIKDLFDNADQQRRLNSVLENIGSINLNPKYIYHGDFLFDKELKETAVIGGNVYSYFSPNLLTYYVSENHESYETLKQSKCGIALHNKYTYTKDGQKFKVNNSSTDFSEVKPSANMYIIFPKIKNYDLKIEQPVLTIVNIWNDIDKLDNFDVLILKFINDYLRQPYNIFTDADKHKTFDGNRIVKEFKGWINKRYMKEIIQAKQPSSISAKQNSLTEYEKFFNTQSPELMTLFENFYNTIRIKNTIYEKLNKTNFPLRTAVIDGDTITDVGGEGFVIHDPQSTVKIVDRIKFSKPNLKRNS